MKHPKLVFEGIDLGVGRPMPEELREISAQCAKYSDLGLLGDITEVRVFCVLRAEGRSPADYPLLDIYFLAEGKAIYGGRTTAPAIEGFLREMCIACGAPYSLLT